MKLTLGIYTEISKSSPVPVFERALGSVYKSLISFLYNNPSYKLSLYQSSSMMKYIREFKPEYRSLFSLLAKRGDLELITGSYSQAILSLMPPKDRANQIEKMTQQIRHDYGVLPTTSFFYGQIWAPLYASTLKACGIDNIVISGYKATSKERLSDDNFVMNELGRHVSVYTISDEISSLVSSYAQNEITYKVLEASIIDAIESSKREHLVVFINIDQLLEGAARDGEDELGKLIINLLLRYRDSLVHLEQVKITKPGYLDSGWYGRDAWASGLQSFNDIFVRNENFRYIFNRYISLLEGASRANRNLKRDISRNLFSVSSGPLFIHDAQCTPLRMSEREMFWDAILSSENAIFDDSGCTAHREYDLEEIGVNDYFSSNKAYTAVLSPKGGSVCEFDYRPKRINIMDTRCPFDKEFHHVPLLKSFSDRFVFDKPYSTSERMFDSELLDKKRSEFLFTLNDDSLPVSVIKHYKMRFSTFIVDVTIINKSDNRISGYAESEVYLNKCEMELSLPEQRRAMLINKVVDAKTVKYNYPNSAVQVIFSSTSNFALREENVYQGQYTSLGYEEFSLYKKLVFSFPVSLEKGEAKEYRIVLRVNDPKEKEQ